MARVDRRYGADLFALQMYLEALARLIPIEAQDRLDDMPLT